MTIHKKHRYYFHLPKHGLKDPFDYLVFVFSVITPLFEIPQLLEIYTNHSAVNVSAATWVLFVVDNFVWIAYGIRKKAWPIVVSSILYEIIEVAVVVGIFIYS